MNLLFLLLLETRARFSIEFPIPHVPLCTSPAAMEVVVLRNGHRLFVLELAGSSSKIWMVTVKIMMS